MIGYLKVNTNERKQVLKLIGSMLNFQPHDYEQIEQTSLSSKWLSGIFSGGQQSAASSRNPSPSKGDTLNKSFTELLIQYVDRESKPTPRISLDIGSTTVSSMSKPPNTNLLIGATNKKTDFPSFYSTPPTTQIFNPNTQSMTSLLNRSSLSSGINSPGISAQTNQINDYGILQPPLGANLSNRFNPSPSSLSSSQQSLSNNNNTFLEDALNKNL